MRVICITAVIFMGLTGAAIFGTCVSGQGVSAQQAGERVEAEGELEVYYEDYEYDSRLFFFLKTARERLELRFAGRAPDHFQTGDSVRVRGRRSGQTITPDAGDGVTSATATTTSTTTSTAILPRTFGEQKVLAMLVNFQDNPNARPWTPESARNLVFGTVNNYFRESSYQQTWLTGEVAGWFTLPMNSTCDTTMIASLANQAAAGAGYTPSNYGRLVYTFPSLSCGFSGQGTIGGIPSKSWINGSMTLRTVAHELEHNLGLYHAQALSCGGSVLGDNCTWIEYGDALDILGKSGVTGHSHAFQKERLGWLNYGSSPGITLVDADGTYWIEPYETTGQNPKALKIFKSTDASSGRRIYYYVEFRRPVGFDSFISNNGNIMNGVMVHTGMESAGSSNYMLDMTPETSSMNDPALPVNRSYNDAVAGVTMTVLSVSDWGANVSVAFGPQSCTQASPTVSVSPSQGQWVSAGRR